MLSIFKTKLKSSSNSSAETTTPVSSAFPPLPDGMFYRVEKNNTGNAARFPLLVLVMKNGARSSHDWVDLRVAEATPESVAESMQILSDKHMKKAEIKSTLDGLCGDYIP